MGDCFLAANRLREAEAAFEKFNESMPNRAMLAFNRARVAAQADKPAEALALLEKAFQSHIAAKAAAPYELLAKLLKKLGKEKELIARLEKLRAAEPTSPPGLLPRRSISPRGRVGQGGIAVPRRCSRKVALGRRLRRPDSLKRKHRNADALLAALGEAIDLSEESPEDIDAEEKAIVADAGLLRELAAAARKRLAVAPDKLSYGQRMAVARLALDAKEDGLAGEFFELAIKAGPERTAVALAVWGLGLDDEGRFAAAAKAFQRGIDSKTAAEDSPSLHFYLSFALAQSGRMDEALAAARKAAELAVVRLAALAPIARTRSPRLAAAAEALR